QLDDPLPGQVEFGTCQHAAVGADVLKLTFGFQRSPPPAGQLFRQVVQQLLQIGHGLLVRPLVMVDHVGSPPLGALASRRWMPNSEASAASMRTSIASISGSRSVRSAARKVSRNATLRRPPGSSGPR